MVGQHRTEGELVLEQRRKVEERGGMGSCVTAGGGCRLTETLCVLLWCVCVCASAQVKGDPQNLDVSALWGTYQANRIVRAASIHGMARE